MKITSWSAFENAKLLCAINCTSVSVPSILIRALDQTYELEISRGNYAEMNWMAVRC